MTIALMLAALAAQAAPVIGLETTIPLASRGGIRAYIVDKADPTIVHMQDQRLRWYKVVLSGQCLPIDNQAALITRARNDNRLDRSAFVASDRYPGRVCGIESIAHAAPPAGTPEANRQRDRN